jgi:multidrug efflux pump subunit AcrA (membrane-fusion protein)
VKRPWIAVVIAAAAVLAIWLLVSHRAPAPQEAATPLVPVATVRYGTVEETLDLAGRVGPAAGTQEKLAFSIPGTLGSVDVHLGERVARGDALAELNSTPLALAAQQAAADAQSARAQEANARIDRVSVRLHVDEAELARQQVLLSAGVVARKDVEAAQATVAADRADFASARDQLAAARAQAASASANASSAGYNLSRATLRAPVDGVVVGIYAQPGEVVDSTTPVVAIAQSSLDVATLDVPVTDVARISSGDIVHVRAAGARFDARVGGVAAAVDPATGLAALGIVGVPATIPPGTPIDGSVVYAHAHGLVVPQSSLIADPQSGAMLAFVESRDKSGRQIFSARTVTIAARGGTDVVVSGLRAGDRIATQGAIDLLAPPAGD